MEKNRLGNTDEFVTKICLGTMTWGYQNTEEDAHAQLDYAIKEAGINFIDTAEMYAVPPMKETQGLTEKYIGNWFAKNPSVREKIILASKIAGPGREWIRNGRGIVAKDLEEAVDGSLKRLQTDYIDLYQLHWPQRRVNNFGKLNYHENMFTSSKEEEEELILSILKEFERLQKAGKVKYLGLSNETPWGTMKFLQIAEKYNLPKIQTVQNPYSLLQRQYEVGMAEISMYEGVGLLAYSPLAGGVLSGKYKDGNLPEGSRYKLFGRARQPQNFNERTLKMTQDFEKLANNIGISVVELALAWVNSRKFVHSNIIGATNLEQLKEDIGSAEIKLSKDVFQEVDRIFFQYPNPATF